MKISIKDLIEIIKNNNVQSGQKESHALTQTEIPFRIEEKYFIRTVTHAHTGKIKTICGQFLVLEQAAWIADTGRFYNAIKDTKFDEIEPFTNDLIINMESIVDATNINGDLPSSQK